VGEADPAAARLRKQLAGGLFQTTKVREEGPGAEAAVEGVEAVEAVEGVAVLVG
jgi:hypothetical protein